MRPTVQFIDRKPVVSIPGHGKHRIGKLLSEGKSNAKLAKNDREIYETVGLSLAPANECGIGNVCPFASPECKRACLHKTGRAHIWKRIELARIAKTVCFYLERQWFVDTLMRELIRANRRANRKGLILACRPNVYSDIPWEILLPDMFTELDNAEFWDYTKNPQRVGFQRINYWLTFSRSELNEAHCFDVLSYGLNVAVVFDRGFRVGRQQWPRPLPKTYLGFPVHDGDKTDLRFNDPRGHVIGLALKAPTRAKHAEALAGGFPVDYERQLERALS